VSRQFDYLRYFCKRRPGIDNRPGDIASAGRQPKGGGNMGCLEQMVRNLGDGNSPAPDSISNEQNSPSYHAVLRIEQQIG